MTTGIADLPPEVRAHLRDGIYKAIAVLDRGGMPGFTDQQVPEDAPTPIYNALAFAYGYPDLTTDRQAARHLAVVPIPSRPLSYQARARRTDPATSHQAAATVVKITDTHRRILILLGNHNGGATDEELLAEWEGNVRSRYAAWPPISASGLRSRRSELVHAGKVVDSGEQGTTAAGRRCIVWRLADG